MTLSPEQFNKIALREDLDRVESKVDTLTKNVSTLITSIDGLAKKVDNTNHEFVSNIAAHDRYEKRITRVEKHLELSPT